MKKLILILLLILFNNTAFSQIQDTSIDLSGFVISAINNQPISNCYVSIKGSSRGEITDSVGKFGFMNLELNRDYIFSISAIGYDVFDTSIVLTENINPELIIKLNTNCTFNANSAKEDIRNGDPKLLIVGSIAPIANSEMDNNFEMKYGIKYYDFGCTPPADACIEEYNKTIFQYLTNKFGSEWKISVRIDVCFLEK